MLFDSNEVRNRLFLLSADFNLSAESDSRPQTRLDPKQVIESAQKSWSPLTQNFPEKSPLRKFIHILTADKKIRPKGSDTGPAKWTPA